MPGLPSTPLSVGVLMLRGLTRPPWDFNQRSTSSEIGFVSGAFFWPLQPGAQPATLYFLSVSKGLPFRRMSLM